MRLRHLMQPDRAWLDAASPRRVAHVGLVTCAGLALYGFSIGVWRDPLLGVFVAVKLPLLVALTLGCNGLLNGLLAQLLGSGLGIRQSLLALLSAFALAALLLASLVPVTLFMAWNAPSPASADATSAHAAYLVTHTTLIGLAGVAANCHLLGLLMPKATSRAAAIATWLAWLGGNGFLGAQFSWILRPFFGAPNLRVEFLRAEPLKGNFYEAVWTCLGRAGGGLRWPLFGLGILLLIIPIVKALGRYSTQKSDHERALCTTPSSIDVP